MAAPDYVPVTMADKPRTGLAIPPGRRWTATRPADLDAGQPAGPALGSPGPDQGYALLLAERFEGRLVLAAQEHKKHVVAGCVAVAMRRSSLFGRAPVMADLELAFGIWGFLGEAPPDLVALRRSRFFGASHDYWRQRDIANQIPESTLRLAPASAIAGLSNWRELLGT